MRIKRDHECKLLRTIFGKQSEHLRCVYTHTHLEMYTHTHTYTHKYTRMCIYIHTLIGKRTHIYAHIHNKQKNHEKHFPSQDY